MTTTIVPYVGQTDLLDVWLVDNGDVGFHLFKNNITPGLGTTIGDFVEANYPGYLAQIVGLPGGLSDTVGQFSYTAPVGVAFPPATSGYPYSIYGVYLTGAGDDSPNLVAAWRFDGAPFVLNSIADFVIFGFEMRARQFVAPGTGLDHFDIAYSFNSGTKFKGDGTNQATITVTAKDISGNTVSGYNGPVALDLVVSGDSSFDNFSFNTWGLQDFIGSPTRHPLICNLASGTGMVTCTLNSAAGGTEGDATCRFMGCDSAHAGVSGHVTVTF